MVIDSGHKIVIWAREGILQVTILAERAIFKGVGNIPGRIFPGQYFGGNILGSNFLGDNLQGGNLLGGSYPGGTFSTTKQFWQK